MIIIIFLQEVNLNHSVVIYGVNVIKVILKSKHDFNDTSLQNEIQKRETVCTNIMINTQILIQGSSQHYIAYISQAYGLHYN